MEQKPMFTSSIIGGKTKAVRDNGMCASFKKWLRLHARVFDETFLYLLSLKINLY